MRIELKNDGSIILGPVFNQLFTNSAIGMCVVDKDGFIVKSSSSLEKILGYSEEELKKITFYEITHREDIEEDSNNVEKILNGDIDFYKINKRYIKKDGSIVYAILHVIGIRDDRNKFLYFISQIEDITELKEKNRILDFKNKNLENFAYAASHDLQEPLRKIFAFSSIIKDKMNRICPESSEKSELFRDLESLISASKRMSRLIDDLLEYSRIGRMDFELEIVNINEVIEEVKYLLSIVLKESNVDLKVSKLPIIIANKTQIIQLFQNLLLNAIKFSKKEINSVINIYEVESNSSDVILCVEDNGIGFNMEFSEKIFKPFERLHGRNEYEGSGMGLALCKSIVDGFGGEIWAESEIGKGSKFFVRFRKGFLNE